MRDDGPNYCGDFMKVLLVATNQAERYMARMVVRPLPIGLAYLAASIDVEKHQLQVLDLMFSDDAIADVDAAIKGFQPDIVGLSIRNLDNQSYLNPVSHLPIVRDIVSRIHSISKATVVCGGPAFSILPVECFEFLEADLGLAGDAVESFANLIDRLENGTGYEDIPGLVYRENGQVLVRDRGAPSDFSTSPKLDLLDISRYDKAGFGIGVVTKLAPYYYPTTDREGQSGIDDWRIRPVDEVIEEIHRLRDDFGIRKVFFIDTGFNIPLDNGKALCKALIASDLRIRWNSYLRTGDCDNEMIELMKSSGCSLVLMAGRGGHIHESELEGHLEDTRRLVTLCRDSDLPFTLSFDFGEPGETESSVNGKLAFLDEVDPPFATLRVGTRILPGTTIANAALEERLIASEAELIRPIFYIASAVKDWVVERLRDDANRHPRWNLI